MRKIRQRSTGDDPPRSVVANRTELSLLARGIDLQSAKRLRRAGWTLGSLQQKTDRQLFQLGIRREQFGALRQGGRPEVPVDHVVQILFANRFTCCVCRDRTRSIVIHHIDEWAQTHDHSLPNLAAICLDCHGKAHTTHRLSRNLTPDVLRGFKEEWEAAVRSLDAEAILDASRQVSEAWLYFNHFRLFQLAESLGIRLKRNPGLAAAVSHGMAMRNGHLTDRRQGREFYMYQGGDGIALYDYMLWVFDEVLSQVSVFNASDLMDRTALRPKLAQGDFLYVQGRHTFRVDETGAEGAEQTRHGTRKANGVRFDFSFNAWEATSSSARATWLSGSQDVGSIIRVVSVTSTPSVLRVKGTVFAICQPLPDQKHRDYAPVLPRVIRDRSDDE